MIRFVVTSGHEHTTKALRDPLPGTPQLPVEVWTYSALFAAKDLPAGTWIFSDIERLAVWELRLAGEIARLMRQAPEHFRILNDPARAAGRYELLLRLHAAGFNAFRAWRTEDGMPPARLPVFLRLESNHRFPITDLLRTEKQLAEALNRLRRMGIPWRGALIVEYHAEESAPGIFRKYGAYRIGDRIVADHIIQDVKWMAKYGHEDAFSSEFDELEAAYVQDNPHAHELMRAFEIGGIEYGRVDYGIVDGKLQVWEINTNPHVPRGDPEKARPSRVTATIAARENRNAAFATLDSAAAGLLEIESPLLQEHRQRQNPIHRDLVRE